MKEIFIKHWRIRRYGVVKGVLFSVGEFFNRIFLFSIEKRRKIAYENHLHRLNLSRPIYDLFELRKIVEEFDVVVVGSDQVWNPEFLVYSDYAYLLPFRLKKWRKVAYAASIGASDLSSVPAKILNMYSKCLRDFDFVSLRERTHAKFLSKLIGKEVHHTLDPTLLMDSEWWYQQILNTGGITDLDLEPGKYVFVYNLSYDTLVKLESLIHELISEGIDIVAYAMPRLSVRGNISNFLFFTKALLKDIKFVEYIDSFEFLWLVKNAKYIITNSYHGTIFSIIFEKPFVTIPFRGRSVRMFDLLDLLGLKHRIVYTPDEVLRKLKEDSIDFKKVKTILEFHRRRSLKLLMSALSDKS